MKTSTMFLMFVLFMFMGSLTESFTGYCIGLIFTITLIFYDEIIDGEGLGEAKQ